jgi:N6-L-threonylcarbamoyladenine synthase
MLDKIATTPDFVKYPMPWPKVEGAELDFSFSGLKTAVINLTHNAEQKGTPIDVPVLSATVRCRVCDILIANTMKAAELTGLKDIVIAGGVSANSELRDRMATECKSRGYSLYFPEKKYCGDNAAMVGAQAIFEFEAGNIAGSGLNAQATMSIE